MTRDQLFSLRRGCSLHLVREHPLLPRRAVYVDWAESTYLRRIRGDDGKEHALCDRDMCTHYEIESVAS